MAVAELHGLFVIEDAAQGMMSTYKGRPLGSIGHIGAYSFHETKNYTSAGEGGLLIINDEKFSARAEIIREKGTNRSQFFRGMVDKYSWVDIGSSYLPSDVQAAFLWGQLERVDVINRSRLDSWMKYRELLSKVSNREGVDLPFIPEGCVHNAHMFYLKVKDLAERSALLDHLKEKDVYGVFHYIPLHSAVAGQKFSRFHGVDKYTTQESERLIRLPLWYGMPADDCEMVARSVIEFFN
ncbi:dTDP-4-amino-4,6-dideoxygalactose transaminase [compost metagenome]